MSWLGVLAVKLAVSVLIPGRWAPSLGLLRKGLRFEMVSSPASEENGSALPHSQDRTAEREEHTQYSWLEKDVHANRIYRTIQ